MNTKLCCVAVFVFGFFTAPFAVAQSQEGSYGNGGGQRFRCESEDGRYTQCGGDTRNGARLVRQISRAACIEGQSWGFNDRGVWVDRGCRAEFESVYAGDYRPSQPGWGGGSSGYPVGCNSSRSRYNKCPMDTRGGVRLVKQISRSSCVEGQTWGWDQEGVWVDKGCSGEFIAGRGGGGYRPTPAPPVWGGRPIGNVVGCNSSRSRYNKCPMDTRGGVRLIRQISRSSCVEGQSWGWDQEGVWVDKGCSAEFESGGGRGGYHNSGGYVRPGSGYNQPTGSAYNGGERVIRCESVDERQQYCNLGGIGGARLQRQLSRFACTEGQTWGSDGRGVWVNQGCRAEFVVW